VVFPDRLAQINIERDVQLPTLLLEVGASVASRGTIVIFG
jgi:hypothetical protein